MSKNKQHWWENRAWRMVQTNLREIDMADISADQYVQDLQSFHANTVMINTGGIVANYNTQLPFHYKNPYLQGDSLEQIIKACHSAGIRVFARVDFSKVRMAIYEQNPQWAYLSPKGEIINYNGDVHMCFNSEYQRVHALSIMREIVELLDVDGFFMNMSGYQMSYDYTRGWMGICQCENCQRDFFRRYGHRIPLEPDESNLVYQKYLQYQRETTQEYYDDIAGAMRAIKPDICLNKIDYLRTEAGTWVEIPEMNYHYKAAEITKAAKYSFPGKVPASTTVDFIDMIYRFSAVAPQQQVLRIAEAVANGGVADYYMMARLDNNPDKSGHRPLQEMFRYLAENEADYTTGVQSLAKIALIKPRLEGFNVRNGAMMADYMGWFRFLSQYHYLFDCIEHGALEKISLDKYATVILPDIAMLSDQETQKLDAFAQRGGTLICDGEAGLRDEKNAVRNTPGLACLGIERVGLVARNIQAAYFQLSQEDPFPLFAKENTTRIHLYGDYVYADYTSETVKYMRLIPPHMFAPPERAYHTNITEYPAVTIHRHGKGHGVYIPWKPAADYYRYGFPATCRFLADLLENVLHTSRITGNLPPMVEVNYSAAPDGNARYVHLVNGSGYFINAYFDPIELHDLEVEIPYEKKPLSVESMVQKKPLPYQLADGKLTIQVDKMGLFEAVKIL
ncbi:alpha-amylase family protein [Oscillospiraceae bacterium MB08-C2-2]|nr:alpha-amylase family protein [Oscillospiraceae bacterium MB08-C2-2]